MYFIYKYVYRGEIIYIGKTKRDLSERIYEHSVELKFLPYLNESKIYYFELPTHVEMDIYEKYLINVYMPKLNVVDTDGARFNFKINEPKADEKEIVFEDDSNNIFNDAVTPFESVALFNDRVSDEDSAAENNLVSDTINLDSSDSSSNSMSSDSNNFNSLTDDSLSNAMPEMFWMVDEPKEDLPEDNNEAISFDSQVDALMGKTKVKEKVL